MVGAPGPMPTWSGLTPTLMPLKSTFAECGLLLDHWRPKEGGVGEDTEEEEAEGQAGAGREDALEP